VISSCHCWVSFHVDWFSLVSHRRHRHRFVSLGLALNCFLIWWYYCFCYCFLLFLFSVVIPVYCCYSCFLLLLFTVVIPVFCCYFLYTYVEVCHCRTLWSKSEPFTKYCRSLKKLRRIWLRKGLMQLNASDYHCISPLPMEAMDKGFTVL
jgi:hypothetical protein